MLGQKKTILIVDDEYCIRDFMHAILEQWGYTVFEACDGEQALAVCDVQTIDLIVSDLMMPGPSIVEILAAIKGEHPNLPVIIMSGLLALSPYLKPLRRMGIRIFLRKPFTFDELKKAVEKALSDASASEKVTSCQLTVNNKKEDGWQLTARKKKVVS